MAMQMHNESNKQQMQLIAQTEKLMEERKEADKRYMEAKLALSQLQDQLKGDCEKTMQEKQDLLEKNEKLDIERKQTIRKYEQDMTNMNNEHELFQQRMKEQVSETLVLEQKAKEEKDYLQRELDDHKKQHQSQVTAMADRIAALELEL